MEMETLFKIEPKFQDVIDELKRERDYQDNKRGTVDENPHEVGQWLKIIRKKLDAAEEAYAACFTHSARAEIVQVAAVAVACLEEHGVVRPRQ